MTARRPPVLASQRLELWLNGRQLAGHELSTDWSTVSAEAPREEWLAGGNELLSIYELERARQHFEWARERSASAEVQGLAFEGLADAALLTSRVEEAYRCYESALSRGRPLPHAIALATKAMLSLYWRGNVEAGLRIARQALALAGQPLPEGRTLSLVSLASAVAQQPLPSSSRLAPELTG